MIDFMSKLRGQYGSKTVHLILDRSGYHRSMLVSDIRMYKQNDGY
jgi:hypothetical protein